MMCGCQGLGQIDGKDAELARLRARVGYLEGRERQAKAIIAEGLVVMDLKDAQIARLEAKLAAPEAQP